MKELSNLLQRSDWRALLSAFKRRALGPYGLDLQFGEAPIYFYVESFGTKGPVPVFDRSEFCLLLKEGKWEEPPKKQVRVLLTPASFNQLDLLTGCVEYKAKFSLKPDHIRIILDPENERCSAMLGSSMYR